MRGFRRNVLAMVCGAIMIVATSTAMSPVAASQSAAAADAPCVANPFGSRPLYLKGGFNGWSADPGFQFVYNCNRFELLVDVSGTSDFKIADASWSADADFGGGAAGGQVVAGAPLPLALGGSNLTFAFDGVQQVVLDISQSSTTPTLTITRCPQNPLGDALLGLSGDFNGFNPAPADYFLYDCDGYYLNVDLQGLHEFKILDPLGAPETHLGAADSSHDVVTLNQPFPLSSDAEAGVTASLHFDFTGEHTMKVSFEGAGRQPVLTITDRTWVNPGIPVPVTDTVARRVRYDSRQTPFHAPYGAVTTGKKVRFALEAPVGVDAATLVVETRRVEGAEDVIEYLDPVRLPMIRTRDGDADRWTAAYRFGQKNVYGYYFELSIGGQQYVYQNNDDSIYWTKERGSFGMGQIAFLPTDRKDLRRYRQTVYSPDFKVPEWAKDAVYYYIFPERFRNGETANDPQPGRETYLDGPVEFHQNWLDKPNVPGDADGSTTDDDTYNNDFFGGDLAGIIGKLGYLKRLGVNTLYINPIFEAGSNHKYDTTDYMQVDDNFGTNADLSRLTREAKAHGIRVILDTSLNHTGSDSVYFDRYANHPGVGAFENATIRPDSPWADWYRFYPNETDPDRQYSGWAGVPTLPEVVESDSFKNFAFRNPDSVMNTWLDRGTAGWRMDVTPWVSDQFWREWRSSVKTHRPNALTVAETWFDSSKYFLGDTFDSTMNYIFRNALIDYAAGRNAKQAYQSIELMREAYPPQAFYALMNLLSTHDAARTLYQLGYTDPSNPQQQITEAKQRFRLAALFQMTFPGSPAVFYGDEVGLTGGADPFNRATYPWADKGGDPDNALLADFQKLIGLRNHNAVLRRGSIDAPLHLDENVIVLNRSYKGVGAITAFNNSNTAQQVTVVLPPGDHHRVYRDAMTGRRIASIHGKLTLTVPALYGSVLLTK
ncbi:glycoside hydrolase family 13 protein [Actinoplanes sp. NPDC026623]|uniref:glycoside hydrolase family 13 protein n=1 Tax=Actinoplanes sp. NPDC026623 TaxID=3155610 RepID=UPI00340D2C04